MSQPISWGHYTYIKLLDQSKLSYYNFFKILHHDISVMCGWYCEVKIWQQLYIIWYWIFTPLYYTYYLHITNSCTIVV